MSKSGVGGMLLAEAKYINLSLHFLEQVGSPLECFQVTNYKFYDYR